MCTHVPCQHVFPRTPPRGLKTILLYRQMWCSRLLHLAVSHAPRPPSLKPPMLPGLSRRPRRPWSDHLQVRILSETLRPLEFPAMVFLDGTGWTVGGRPSRSRKSKVRSLHDREKGIWTALKKPYSKNVDKRKLLRLEMCFCCFTLGCRIHVSLYYRLAQGKPGATCW